MEKITREHANKLIPKLREYFNAPDSYIFIEIEKIQESPEGLRQYGMRKYTDTNITISIDIPIQTTNPKEIEKVKDIFTWNQNKYLERDNDE